MRLACSQNPEKHLDLFIASTFFIRSIITLKQLCSLHIISSHLQILLMHSIYLLFSLLTLTKTLLAIPLIVHLPTQQQPVDAVLQKRFDADDPCADIFNDITGRSRYDCKKKLKVVNGHCTVPSTFAKLGCKGYCEIRRSVFLGPEQRVGGVNAAVNPPGKGQKTTLAAGIDISIETSAVYSLGFSPGLNAVYAAGVSFTYLLGETTTTTTSSFTLQGNTSEKYWSTWVAFPLMIETCGTLTEVDSKLLPSGGRGQPPLKVCGGNPRTTENSCSKVLFRGQGTKPQLIFALRKSLIFLSLVDLRADGDPGYQDENGNIAPLEEQGVGYKYLCLKSKQGTCVAKKTPGVTIAP